MEPNKYANGKIYKIESLSAGLVYYGSTYTSLAKRMYRHRNQERSKSMMTSREVLAYPDAEIVLVENYPCNSKDELHAREHFYISNNTCVNQRGKHGIVATDPTEYARQYYEIVRERVLEQKRNRPQEVIDAINARRRETWRASNAGAEKQRQMRASMTEEEKEKYRRRNRITQRAYRARKKAEQEHQE